MRGRYLDPPEESLLLHHRLQPRGGRRDPLDHLHADRRRRLVPKAPDRASPEETPTADAIRAEDGSSTGRAGGGEGIRDGHLRRIRPRTVLIHVVAWSIGLAWMLPFVGVAMLAFRHLSQPIFGWRNLSPLPVPVYHD